MYRLYAFEISAQVINEILNTWDLFSFQQFGPVDITLYVMYNFQGSNIIIAHIVFHFSGVLM